MDKTYKFHVQVTCVDDSKVEEVHSVLDKDTQFGAAFACGKVVRFYEQLKADKKIKDYRMLY